MRIRAVVLSAALCFYGLTLEAQGHAQQSGLNLAAPKDIELKGNIRKEDMASAVGRIRLRWPRKVELLFGRTPQRAMAEAASATSRALKRAGFPTELQALDLNWEVVFMDEQLPEKQIPTFLVSNCHPAWMTPPSNIYVVAQRVAAGCGGAQTSKSSVADSQLAQVLMHEMGHAVEHQLLKNMFGSDRMRAEGFASWFEQYAAQFSSVVPSGATERYYLSLAKQSMLQQGPAFAFQGSAHDYARASMYFKAIQEKRGVRGIIDVYQRISKDRIDFFSAIERELNWNRQKIEKEIERIVLKG